MCDAMGIMTLGISEAFSAEPDTPTVAATPTVPAAAQSASGSDGVSEDDVNRRRLAAAGMSGTNATSGLGVPGSAHIGVKSALGQ